MSNKIAILVDDNAIDHVVNKRFMELVEPGLEVKGFLTVEEALAWIAAEAERNAYNKIYCFLDIYMPVVDGFDFLKKMEEYSPDFLKKIILFMLSSSIDSDDLARVEQHPLVHSFVSKPLTVYKLSELLAE